MEGIVISDEGIVFCNGIPCSKWMEMETTCKDCALDKVLISLQKHQIQKSEKQWKTS